jgi:septal ring factor EnvC (AmiA/AmiB activator)
MVAAAVLAGGLTVSAAAAAPPSPGGRVPAEATGDGRASRGSAGASDRGAPRIDESRARSELDRIERALSAQRKVLDQLRARETSVFEALESSDRALAASRAEAGRLGAELAEVRARLDETEARARAFEADLHAQQRALEARAVALYKLGPLGPAEALLSARSLTDLARRARYLRAILAADRDQVARYDSGRKALNRESAALRAQQEELAALERRQQDLADGLAAEQAARRALLDTIRDEQTLAEQAAAELAASAESLRALLEKLEAEAVARALEGVRTPPPGDFQALRGRLAPPVPGDVVTPFGPREHPRFRTVTVSNGVEIRAPAGTEVRAVHHGRVVFAGWFRGYGKMLILDHGDQFYTLYAHAAELYKAVGEGVRQGEVVASVGETGALDGPVLYFEIRQAGKPLDPSDWLARSEARRR